MTSRDASPTADLWLLGIDALEVLEDRATLVRRESTQLVPCRLAEPRRGAPARVVGSRIESRVARRRLGFALVVVFALFLLERAPCVQQPTEQLLLPRHGARVHLRLVQRLGQ